LYRCLDLIRHNIGTHLKHNKYIFDIPIPFCHNLYLSATLKQFLTEFAARYNLLHHYGCSHSDIIFLQNCKYMYCSHIYINIERFLIIEYVSSISIFKCLNFILQDYICKMATIDIVEAERGRQNIICQ
jgi:hypothetical protein